MDVEEGVGERFRVEGCSYNFGVGDVEVGMEREVFLYRSDAAAWLDGAAERDQEGGKAASCIIECLRNGSMV